LHGNVLARQPNLVVPDSPIVEPCILLFSYRKTRTLEQTCLDLTPLYYIFILKYGGVVLYCKIGIDIANNGNEYMTTHLHVGYGPDSAHVAEAGHVVDEALQQQHPCYVQVTVHTSLCFCCNQSPHTIIISSALYLSRSNFVHLLTLIYSIMLTSIPFLICPIYHIISTSVHQYVRCNTIITQYDPFYTSTS
jgi:hypothetical protein